MTFLDIIEGLSLFFNFVSELKIAHEEDRKSSK